MQLTEETNDENNKILIKIILSIHIWVIKGMSVPF